MTCLFAKSVGCRTQSGVRRNGAPVMVERYGTGLIPAPRMPVQRDVDDFGWLVRLSVRIRFKFIEGGSMPTHTLDYAVGRPVAPQNDFMSLVNLHLDIRAKIGAKTDKHWFRGNRPSKSN